mmetsp:Transcript_4790/g.7479  ORF Transcript_4790/g.7479 Transcript_4790/m.7479 type:complete len:581 (+) Transcript_4790:91-1833(+)
MPNYSPSRRNNDHYHYNDRSPTTSTMNRRESSHRNRDPNPKEKHYVYKQEKHYIFNQKQSKPLNRQELHEQNYRQQQEYEKERDYHHRGYDKRDKNYPDKIHVRDHNDSISRLGDDTAFTSSSPSFPYFDPENVKDDGTTIEWCVDLPGVEPETLKAVFHEKTFTLSGCRNSGGMKAFGSEFDVDVTAIDTDSIKANLRHGVLIIKADKIKRKPPRDIPITSYENEEEEEEGEGDLRNQLRQAKRQAGAYKANWHKACKLNAELEVKVDKLITDLEISKKRTKSFSSLESKVKELTEELESTKSKIPAEYTPAEFWDNFNADTITPTSGTSKESIQSFDPFEMFDESSEGVGIEEEVVADVAAMPVVNASSPSSCEDDVSSEIEKFDPFGSRSIIANQNVSDGPISLVEWRPSTSTSKKNRDKESLLQKDSIAKKTPSNKLRQRAQAVLKITKDRANNLLMKGPLTSSGTYNKMLEDSSKTKNNRRSHSVERLLEKSKQRVPEIMNNKCEGDNNSPAVVVDQEKKRDFVKENAEVMNLLRESKRRLSRQGSSKSDNDEDTCVSLGNDDDGIPLTVVTTGD